MRISSRESSACSTGAVSGSPFRTSRAARRRREATGCTRCWRLYGTDVRIARRASSGCTCSRRQRRCSGRRKKVARSMWSRDSRNRNLSLGLAATAVAATIVALSLSPRGADGFVVTRLVSDPGTAALGHDVALVNAWGLAASPTGPWWTANEARSASSLFAASGRKQALSVKVDGGPTGIVFNDGSGFVVHGGGASGPARFLYACEDGSIRGWSPTVPHGWSKVAVVAVDEGGKGTIFRGLAIAKLADGSKRLYATDFHNDRVEMFDSRWRRVVLHGAFVDHAIPSWDSPFGIQPIGGHVFVTYASPAPVNGNDSPTGGYLDEFDVDGKLVARVARMGNLAEPWGVALAPQGFGKFGGHLLVANFGSGRVNAYARHADGWSFAGQLAGRGGRPLTVGGLWGIAFGNGEMGGPRDTLFFAAGPHRWRGDSELSVHGLFGSISES